MVSSEYYKNGERLDGIPLPTKDSIQYVKENGDIALGDYCITYLNQEEKEFFHIIKSQ